MDQIYIICLINTFTTTRNENVIRLMLKMLSRPNMTFFTAELEMQESEMQLFFSSSSFSSSPSFLYVIPNHITSPVMPLLSCAVSLFLSFSFLQFLSLTRLAPPLRSFSFLHHPPLLPPPIPQSLPFPPCPSIYPSSTIPPLSPAPIPVLLW